ncbi:MAG: SIMPL domain-containing protein [Alphaproteobacteria bacterium]|nr:SIMPL domain-containing protein [Alphaproteobacteria bacterium]
MRRFLTLLAGGVLWVSIATPALAQREDPLLTMPDGQAIINISATERLEVEQDLLVATLAVQIVDRDPRAVQNQINQTMSKALSRAQKVSSVKSSTGAYQVYEYTEPRTKERKWRGQQSLTLKSKAADDLLGLAGDLQDLGLNMNGLTYMLAPETAARIQDQLMEAALAQLQSRAERAAKALGKSKAELREINVQGQTPQPYAMPMARMEMAMASDSMAAPVAAAGESTITLTVSARALLKP